MAALDFPSSPTNGQQYSAPNGVIYTFDGTVWTTSGVLSTGTAAGGALSGTYPNPTLAPGVTLTATPSVAGTLMSNVATTLVLLCEITFTVTAGRPLLVFGLADGSWQCLVTPATNSAITVALRRGGTNGATDGAVTGQGQMPKVFTSVAQYERIPYSVVVLDEYTAGANGTARYSMTLVGDLAASTVALTGQGRIVGLQFA